MREGVKMRRCEDEKMRYRPPLLEEPCAQTLSGMKKVLNPLGTRFFGPSLAHWIPMHQKKTSGYDIHSSPWKIATINGGL